MISCRRWLVISACVAACLARAHVSAAATCTWTGNGMTNVWSDAANWDGCGGAHAIPESGDELVFADGALRATNVNDIVGLQLLGVAIQGDASGGVPYAISGEDIRLEGQLFVTVGVSAPGPAFLPRILAVSGHLVRIQHLGPGSFPVTVGDIDLGNESLFVHAVSGGIVITGTISGSETATLTKFGGFDLVLLGANTYGGVTEIRAGDIEVRSPTALGTSGDGKTSRHTILRRNTRATIAAGLTVDESFDAEDVTTGQPGTLFLPGGTATLTGLVASDNLDVMLVASLGATLTVEGPINLGPARGLVKAGAGAVIVTNPANDWDHTDVFGGTLRLGASGAFPDDATLSMAPGAFFEMDAAKDETIGTVLTASGTIVLSAGTLTINQSTLGHVDGVITGAGGIVKTGPDTLMLDGLLANTYTGTTTVTQGGLRLFKPVGVSAIAGAIVVHGGSLDWQGFDQVDDASAIEVNAPGRLRLDMFGERIGSLAGTGNVDLMFGNSLAVGGTHASTVYSGVLSGSGNVRKEGAGTFTVTGAHPLSVGINLAGGTLLVHGTVGAVGLNGGVLGGNGSVGTVVPTAFGGMVSPGASPGILTVGNAALGAGTTFAVELNGPSPGTGYDQLKATGNITLFGATLSATIGFVPAPGTAFTIVDVAGGGAALGTFLGLPQNAPLVIGGRPFRISYTGGDGNDVVLTALALPEISIDDVTVTEGNSGSTNAVFTVSLSSDPLESVSVQYATVNTTAASPQDYASQSGTLVFLPGHQTQTVTVAVHGDTAVEAVETFIVRLSNVQGAGSIADADGVGTIGNDDVSPEPEPTPTALTWFLAEGATGAFFDNDLLIANPTTTPAPVTLTFFTEGGSTVVDQRTIPAQSRATIHVDQLAGLENASAAVQVASTDGVPLVVERTMFWDASYYGGHTGAAVSQAAPTWYFAEASQGFFETFVLVTNANTTAAEVTLTFLREGEPPVVKAVPVGASSRVTIGASTFSELVGRSFGVIVEATQPIIAERAMYFGTMSTGTGPTQLWSGGHESPGVTQTSTSWFHAEGATGSFFDTFILLSNPQNDDAQVTLDFLTESGATVRATRVVPAKGRVTVDVEAQDDPRVKAGAVSTVVTSDRPIVSERSTYWAGDARPWGEGHNSFGLTETAATWGLAEGRVGGTHHFTTFILLANPQTSAADVTVTYLRESGAPIVKTYTLLPESRFTIGVNSDVPELQNEAFGARIEVTNGVPIAVERSMYWDANGIFWAGGSHASGTRLP